MFAPEDDFPIIGARREHSAKFRMSLRIDHGQSIIQSVSQSTTNSRYHSARGVCLEEGTTDLRPTKHLNAPTRHTKRLLRVCMYPMSVNDRSPSLSVPDIPSQRLNQSMLPDHLENPDRSVRGASCQTASIIIQRSIVLCDAKRQSSQM